MSQQPRVQNFKPAGGNCTVNILAATTNPLNFRTGKTFQDSDMEFTNAGSSTVFLNWGDTSAGAAAVAPTVGSPAVGKPLLAGQTKVYYIGFATWIDVISVTGSNTVYATPGLGS